jgi:hypothetical protein
MGNPLQLQELFEKIRALPEEKVAEVEDLVDFLHHREDDRLVRVQEAEASGEARSFLRLPKAGSGPEALSSRREAVRELSNFHLPVGDSQDLERESIHESNEVAKRARQLVESGVASWGGGKPRGSHPKPRIKGKSASEVVLEDRR